MKTFYVSLEYSYYDVEVEADSEEGAIEQAKDVIRRGFISPDDVSERVETVEE